MSHGEQVLGILDEKGEVISQASRLVIHRDGLLHGEVHVWLYTPEGRIIFQKRAKTKDTYPGLLSVSVGGHIDLGLSPEEAAVKELEEETGIVVSSSALDHIYTMRSTFYDSITGLVNNVIQYGFSYFYQGSIQDLQVEKGEADGFEAYSLQDLESLSSLDREGFIEEILTDSFFGVYRLLDKKHAEKRSKTI